MDFKEILKTAENVLTSYNQIMIRLDDGVLVLVGIIFISYEPTTFEVIGTVDEFVEIYM